MSKPLKRTLFLTLLLVYSSINCIWAQWQSLGFGSDHLFEAIHFIDVNTGFVSGDKEVFRTLDGGESWEMVYQSPGLTNVKLFDITSLDDTTFFIAGGRYAPQATSMVLKSTDKGDNWYKANTPLETDWLNDILFVNDSIGYAAGDHATILKTYDRGENWEKLPFNTDVFLNGLHFFDANNGLVVGGLHSNTTSIFRTDDGGQSWTEIETDAIAKFLIAIDFPTPSTGYIVGWEETVLKTTDGGSSWEALSCDYNGGSYSMVH